MATATPGTLGEQRIFTTLDGMRFVAALLVVTRHVPTIFGKGLFPKSYLAVDLFFALSGFVIANAYERKLLANNISIRTFLRVRAIRLYPLYFLGMTLGVIASSIAHSIGPVQLAYYSLTSVLLIPNLGMGGLFPLDHPAWSLFLEAGINIVYVLALRRLIGCRLGLLIIAAALALATEAVAFHNLDVGWAPETLLFGIPRVVFSFYIGVLIYRFHTRLGARSYRPRLSNAVPWLLMGCVTAILTCPVTEFLSPWFEIVVVTCLFPSLVLAAIWFQPTGASASVFRFGGLLSYAVYVLHEPLGALFRSAYGMGASMGVGVHPILAGLAFIIGLLSVCSAACAFYDGPLRRALGHLVRRPDTTPSAVVAIFSKRNA